MLGQRGRGWLLGVPSTVPAALTQLPARLPLRPPPHSGLRAALFSAKPATLPTYLMARAAPAHRLLHGGLGQAGGVQQPAPRRSGAAFVAATPLEEHEAFVARVVAIYLHTIWGMLKQAALAVLALVTASALLSMEAPPGVALFLVAFVVLPLYVIAAVESAGASKHEARGFALLNSALRGLWNSMPAFPPSLWGKK